MNVDRKPILSVVICTFNRSDDLARAMDSVLAQDGVGEIACELIVVDNRSTDDTEQVCRSRMQSAPVPVRYAREEKQGLSHARNRGWREAHGEYVVYPDDDAQADAGWLRCAMNIIENEKPLAFGGPFFPFYLDGRPVWFRDEWGTRTLGDQPRWLTREEDLSGGNMTIRRDVLERVGGFDPRRGMRGCHVAYGEETLLQRQIYEGLPSQRCIYYHPDFSIRHRVRPAKFTLRWRMREIYNRELSHVMIRNTQAVRQVQWWRLLRSLLVAMVDLALNFGWRWRRRDRARYPHAMTWFYEEGLKPVGWFGRAAAWWELRRGGVGS